MKLYYTLLLAALPCTIFAQSNYHEGYVIKNNGDTLKGFIDYHQWDQNPRSVGFKISKDNRQSLTFSPGIIKEFQVNDETYVAYTGPISMDKNKFPNLPLALDTGKKTDTIFLKELVKGKNLTLLYHRDAVKTRFFIAETNSQPVELKYMQYYDNSVQVVVKPLYRGQLLFYINKYTPGNAKLAQDAGETSFEETDLEKIVSAINGENIAVKKESHYRFFLGGGVNAIKSNYRDNILVVVYTQVGPLTETDTYPEKVSKFSTTVSPLLDFGIDLFANPEVQKVIYRAEISFSYNSPKFQYLVAKRTDNPDTNDTYSFDQYSTTLTPQIILNLYNKDNFKIYIDGGIGLNFSAYSNENLSKGTKDDLHAFWLNIPVQAGIVLNKRLEFSLGYSAPADMVNFFGSSGISNQHVAVGLKYLFNRP